MGKTPDIQGFITLVSLRIDDKCKHIITKMAAYSERYSYQIEQQLFVQENN